jgi:hypothetical protein
MLARRRSRKTGFPVIVRASPLRPGGFTENQTLPYNFCVASPSFAEVTETRIFWSFCHRFAASLSGRTVNPWLNLGRGQRLPVVQNTATSAHLTSETGHARSSAFPAYLGPISKAAANQVKPKRLCRQARMIVDSKPPMRSFSQT